MVYADDHVVAEPCEEEEPDYYGVETYLDQPGRQPDATDSAGARYQVGQSDALQRCDVTSGTSHR